MKKLLFPLLTITSLVIIGCSDSNSKNAASNTPQFKKMTWTSDQPAAADSLQGQLQAQGKKWVKTSGTIKRGDYVQDILDPRLNQPEGRGAIAKVISVSGGDTGPFTALMQRVWRAFFPKPASTASQGPPAALVDFGRGYRAGINLSELSPVSIQ